MKIDQTTGSATALRLPVKTRPGPARPAPAPEGVKGQAPSSVRQFPESADGTFSAAKVAAIKEQIRSGQYRINPERIADGLLDSLRALAPAAK